MKVEKGMSIAAVITFLMDHRPLSFAVGLPLVPVVMPMLERTRTTRLLRLVEQYHRCEFDVRERQGPRVRMVQALAHITLKAHEADELTEELAEDGAAVYREGMDPDAGMDECLLRASQAIRNATLMLAQMEEGSPDHDPRN